MRLALYATEVIQQLKYSERSELNPLRLPDYAKLAADVRLSIS